MSSIVPIFSESGDAIAGGACVGCRNDSAFELEFDFAYQPIVDFASRTIFAHEALVRGLNGEGAASILAQVNDNNRYRFDQLCRVKAVQGAARLGMKEFLSINFLPNAVYKPEVCIQTTFEAAREHQFPIERIIFEVTEGERVQDRPHLVNIFRQYHDFGFKTAIDDFGAGYAGLNLLSEYQPDIIKIDMDLVRGIDTQHARQAIVKGIASICLELQIKVLAEGIETREERDFLSSIGISLMQGYWFCKPVFQGLGVIPTAAWE
ncbi:EAL domain-containing protein [Undibacterium sp. Ji22W]|uniref:EAL domain-containing protein n=1 Tax=Undibacterium sp. Ji22W TaxID=3413038 RepID=UPI003BF27564